MSGPDTQPETPGVLRVRGAGLELAVQEHVPWRPGAETVLFVHGYPDDHRVWDRVVAALPHDELHLVTYDVRGAGDSDVPAHRSGYHTDLLVQDLAAVVEATVPAGAQVHLVGHDWGSVQAWDAVNAERGDPRLKGRIASYTSMSGPSLDQVAALDGSAGRLRLVWQRLHSWYIYLFLLPVLPETIWRVFHRQLAWAIARSERRPDTHWGPELVPNAVHGLNLYRANVLRRLRERGALRTDVPVLLLQPRHDRYVTPVVHEGLERRCGSLRRVEVPAGHWMPQTRPDEVAALVLAHVRAHRGRDA